MAEPKKRKKSWNKFFLLLRRVHLYSGLFLIPWALLYGVTAILFNHGTWGTDSRNFSIQTASMESWPTETHFAETVVAAIQSGQGVTCAIDPGTEIRWSSAIAQIETNGTRATIRVAPGDDLVWGRVRPSRTKIPNPFQERLRIPAGKVEVARKETALAEVLGRHPGEGLPQGTPEIRRGPTIHFQATDAEGRKWRMSYDLSRERLRARPAETKLGLRSYLLRLHLSHGYPQHPNARWIWAIAVDLMGAALLLWCFTGILMWAQMSRLRRGGVICLALSAIVAAPLAWAMYAALS